MGPAYSTMAPVKRDDYEGVLPLKADTMTSGTDSGTAGGLKIVSGFVIGWLAVLAVI